MLKTVHQAAVALSIGGFFTRGLAGLLGARWVRGRAARTLPHIVDSVLLASAIAMAWMLRLTPGNALGWRPRSSVSCSTSCSAFLP